MKTLFNHPVGRFIEITFRSMGQAIFQNNPLSGLILIIAIVLNSWVMAVDFLAGAALGTLIAMLLKMDRDMIEAGVFGGGAAYIVAIVGIMAGQQENPLEPILWFVLIMGIFLSVPMVSACGLIWRKLGLSPLSLPLVILVWFLLGGVFYTDLAGVINAPVLYPTGEAAAYSLNTFIQGLGNSYTMLFLYKNPFSGFLILLAIFVNSRILGVMSVLGVLISFPICWLLGYDEFLVRAGILTFNPALTAMALGGMFITFNKWGAVYALLGAILSLWFFVGMSAIVHPLGLIVLALPFAFVTWIMVLAARVSDRVQDVPLTQVTKPEDYLARQT